MGGRQTCDAGRTWYRIEKSKGEGRGKRDGGEGERERERQRPVCLFRRAVVESWSGLRLSLKGTFAPAFRGGKGLKETLS